MISFPTDITATPPLSRSLPISGGSFSSQDLGHVVFTSSLLHLWCHFMLAENYAAPEASLDGHAPCYG